MKVRTIKYIVRDGLTSISKNKLMSLAAISIVVASLTVLGILYIIILNFRHNLMILKKQPEMQVFCQVELDDIGVKIVENTLKNNAKISQIDMVTKEQAFEKLKSMLGDENYVLEGMDNSFLPVSFIIKLHNPEDGEGLIQELKEVRGVDKISYPQKTVDFISKLTGWVQLASSFLITVLMVVSVFIISNTIRLTVFARRKEINIMKYIGATDGFIRWPFIVEGVIIGIIGAGVAFLLSGYGYSALEGRFTNELMRTGTSIISLVEPEDIMAEVLVICAILGCVVGAIGSAVSVRKYLKV
ncbi:MAG: ABC transporter permease [Clostridiaceae bacterium]|nr:ABC transporter permease [Clostridiaceae bacterium]